MNLRTIALKNINRKKSRSILIVIGIVTAITAYASITLLGSAFKEKVSDQLNEFGFNVVVVPRSSNLSLSYGGMDVSGVTTYKTRYLEEADIANIKKIKKDTDMIVSPKLISPVKVEGKPALFVGMDKAEELKVKKWWRAIGDHRAHKDGEVQAKEAKGEKMEDGSVMKGAKDEALALIKHLAGVPLNQTDLLVGSNAAETLGLKTGDTVYINGQFFRVRAALEKTGSQDDNIIFGDIALAQKLFGKEGKYNLVEIMVRDSNNIEPVVGKLGKGLPDATVSSLKQAVKYKEEAMGHLGKFGLSVTVIILAISSMIVFITMTTSVAERAKEIGVLRAIGYRKKKIMVIILWEAVLLSVISGTLGYISGFGVARLLPRLIDGLDVVAKLDLPILAYSISIALVVGVISSIGPAVKAASMDPADALKSL